MEWIAHFLGPLAPAWELFGDAWCAGALVALCLAVPGVICLAREQIFIGAAVAQASTAGVAVGLTLLPVLAASASQGHVHGARQQAFAAACAVLAAVLAALATTPGGRLRRGSPESRTGWVFLFSAAVSILLLVNSPHGAHEIARLVASSVLGATAGDALLFAVVAGLTMVGGCIARDRLILMTIDPNWAGLAGMRRSRWEYGIALWLGLVCGLAIPVTGFLFVFGCLVLPAMIARNLCREIRRQLWVAPVIALLTTIVGFVIAHQQDWPPAPVVITVLAGLVPLTWLLDQLFSSVFTRAVPPSKTPSEPPQKHKPDAP